MYKAIGQGIGWGYTIVKGDKITYSTGAMDVIANNFKITPKKEMFIQDCDGLEGVGAGQFMLTINKICVLQNPLREHVNHEYVHYSLRNSSMPNKMLLRDNIKTLIDDVHTAVDSINIEDLSGDDKEFFHILKNSIDKYASHPDYKFYETMEDMVLAYWGNEEYVTYAIGTIIYLDENKELKFKEYTLNNNQLADIYNLYRTIYSRILRN